MSKSKDNKTPSSPLPSQPDKEETAIRSINKS
jgi:hypothetical protein